MCGGPHQHGEALHPDVSIFRRHNSRALEESGFI